MNKRHRILGTIIFFFGALLVPAFGQDARPVEPAAVRPPQNQMPDERGKVLRQLGLSRDQLQMLRRINMERRPLTDAAQARVRETTRRLDEAIYADIINEPDVQAKLRDMQLAQAEVFRLRFMNELAIRRLLTQPQLVRFRQMRQRFERAERERPNRPIPISERPPIRP